MMQTDPLPNPLLIIVLNAGYGNGAAVDARRTIEEACVAASRDLQIYEVDAPVRLSSLISAALAQAKRVKGIVVAAGGDGTINAVAQTTLGSGCAFGVLPLGTFNYFSRNHGISSDTAAALQVLLAKQPRAVQVGLVNDRLFLVNASIGLYAKLLEDREAFKASTRQYRHLARPHTPDRHRPRDTARSEGCG